MASPAGASGPSRVKKAPRGKGRLTKAEREARENEEAQREAARNAARNVENAATRTSLSARGRGQGDRGRGGRGRARGRGGYMGDSRDSTTVASGPFARGVMTEALAGFGSTLRQGSRSATVRAEGAAAGGRTGSVKSEIKKEDRSVLAGPGVKREAPEDGEYISSDDEEEEQGPRINIDEINLLEMTDDEEDLEAADGSAIKVSEEKTPLSDSAEERERKIRVHRTPGVFAPVRIRRFPHVDRVVGVTTSKSSKENRQLKQDQSPHDAGENVNGADLGTASRVPPATAGRGKTNTTQDVEVTGTNKVFRGVYNDSDNEPSSNPIKMEPDSDEDSSTVAETSPTFKEPQTLPRKQKAGVTIIDDALATDETDATKRLEELSGRKRLILPAPADEMLTKEDEEEWERRDKDLASQWAELGPVPEGVPDAKKNNIYLFQLPPVMPDLYTADLIDSDGKLIKTEDGAAPAVQPPTGKQATAGAQAPKPTTPANTKTMAIKIEEDAGTAPAWPGPKLNRGQAGKLRVHASGRVVFEWGEGMELEVRKGSEAGFYQDAYIAKQVPEDERVKPEEAGKSWGLGPVRGKFVMVPMLDGITC